MDRPWLTPPEVAAELGIEPGKVIAWIHSGELPASDITEKRGERPRWRIRRTDLDDFLRRRQVHQPSESPPNPARRRPAAVGVREFV
jgi:excisionase family DNA binding protein